MWGTGLKALKIYLILLGLITIPALLQAQYINVQLEVTPEVDTQVLQPLDFGQLVAGTGRHRIEAGSPEMGIFYVRALHTQRLLLNLTTTDRLQNNDPAIDASIPIELQASYSNFDVDNYLQSTPMNNFLEDVVVGTAAHNQGSAWSGLYIYIFGNVNVGNVPPGTYSGEIILTVIYD